MVALAGRASAAVRIALGMPGVVVCWQSRWQLSDGIARSALRRIETRRDRNPDGAWATRSKSRLVRLAVVVPDATHNP